MAEHCYKHVEPRKLIQNLNWGKQETRNQTRKPEPLTESRGNTGDDRQMDR